MLEARWLVSRELRKAEQFWLLARISSLCSLQLLTASELPDSQDTQLSGPPTVQRLIRSVGAWSINNDRMGEPVLSHQENFRRESHP